MSSLPDGKNTSTELDTNKLIPIPELDGQILVHQSTGQIYMSGAAVQLSSPAIVVRHGQTDGNLRRVLHGQVDGPENQLNEKGKEQAEFAAVAIFKELNSRWPPQELLELTDSGRLMVMTSPILRARHTAEYFLRLFRTKVGADLPLQEEETLKEMSFGKYDGFALDEIDDSVFADQVRQYRQQQDATVDWCGTGERFIDAVIRARDLIVRLNAYGAGKLFILFTHGTFISAMRVALGDRSLLSETGMILFRDRIVDNAAPCWLPLASTVTESASALRPGA